MRSLPALALALVAVAWSGCVIAPPLVLTTPVGPPPRPAPSGPVGFLEVWTEMEPDDPSDDYPTFHYGPYTVLSRDGRVAVAVPSEGTPKIVTLPVGTYDLRAQTGTYGKIVLPVAVREGETTLVYLDPDKKPDVRNAKEAEIVRLPDGRIVGWRANLP